ncbi:MAG: VOC family protein [Pyrinomonadaceae bacterium]|nr:VOC family protein [Pyrinomonadaceae bacterium]
MNLNQVTIYSAKPMETVEFYRRLGLKIIVDSLPRYARLLCPDGDATLSVHVSEEVQPNSNIVLYFECEDLDERVFALKSGGIEFESDPIDQTWRWREAYLRDPNGNRICLFYAGENRQNPPWRVKS